MSFEGSHVETSSNWSGAYITANQDRRFLQIWGYLDDPGAISICRLRVMQGPAGIPVCLCQLDRSRRAAPVSRFVPSPDGDRIDTAAGWHDHGTVLDAMVGAWDRGFRPGADWARGQSGQPGVCVLTAWDPQTVIGVMVNLSTATGTVVMGTSPTVTLPDGSMVQPDIAGSTAEWIMERPRVVGQTTIYNFPDYGETEFDFCLAVESDDVDIFALFNGIPQQLQGARRIRMFQTLTDPARTAFISMPRKLNDTAIRVKYRRALPERGGCLRRATKRQVSSLHAELELGKR